MTNVSAAGIAEEAADWVARMEDAAWSAQEEAALAAWLDGHPRRRGALLQAQAAWISLDRGVYDDRPVAAPRAGRERRPDRRTVLLGGGMLAASLAGGALLLRSATTYRTQLGEIRSVPLGDGSTAAINSESEVEVSLQPRRRDVRLARGEAWFRVAKDPSRPFVVAAGQVTVRAVGTAFAVRRLAGGADVLVTEGVVETWAAQAGGHRIRLKAGQRAYVGDDSTIRLIGEQPSSVDRALAWRAGNIDLAGRTLASAADELNRHNRRKLVLTDAALAREQFDGLFQLDDPVGFAVAVQRSLGATVDLADPAVIRLGRSGRDEKNPGGLGG